MYLSVVSVLLTLFCSASASTLGRHSSAGGFCYRDEGCGPTSVVWPPLCHTGRQQSPIRLPVMTIPSGITTLKYSVYRGEYFRMQNNGHSLQIDFDGKYPSSQVLTFPDPLMIYGPLGRRHGQRQYKFAAAHFHWGVSDFSTGSEHCIGNICTAMELHLVHYLASYSSLADAVASGDKNALAVIGILIHVSPLEGVTGAIMNDINGQDAETAGTGPLKPIVDNLFKISHADRNTSNYIVVNSPLDLTKLLYEAGAFVYTYKGSLTTPGCNEQVNWFVHRKPATTSHQDLEAFRTILKDGRGIVLNENHRPLQSHNGRKVLLSSVVPF